MLPCNARIFHGKNREISAGHLKPDYGQLYHVESFYGAVA